MSKHSFGGAFDVEDDALFTREDLDKFAEELASSLNIEYMTQDVVAHAKDSYAIDTVDVGVTLIIEVFNDELDELVGSFEHTSEMRVDLRKIQNPSTDLTKHYKQMFLDEFRDEIENYLNELE